MNNPVGFLMFLAVMLVGITGLMIYTLHHNRKAERERDADQE